MDASTFTAHFKGERPRMGATDLRDIFAPEIGLKGYRSPFQVQQEKLGNTEPIEASEVMVSGTELEPLVLRRYQKKTGIVMEAAPKEGFRHPLYPFMGATPDFWTPDRTRLMQAKTHSGRLSRAYGEAGSDDVPEIEILQNTWEMHIANELHKAGEVFPQMIEEDDLAVYFGGPDFFVGTVSYKPDVAAAMEEFCIEWVAKHIVERQPLEPWADDGDVLAGMYRKRPPVEDTAIDAPAEIMPHLELLHRLNPEYKAMEKQIEASKNAIKAFLIESGNEMLHYELTGYNAAKLIPTKASTYTVNKKAGHMLKGSWSKGDKD